MGFSQAFLCFFALLIFLPFLSISSTVKQIYIIHMKYQYKPFPYATHHDWYSAQLQSLSLTPIHPSFTLTPTQSMASLPNLTQTKPNHSVNPTQSSVFTKTPSIPSTPLAHSSSLAFTPNPVKTLISSNKPPMMLLSMF